MPRSITTGKTGVISGISYIMRVRASVKKVCVKCKSVKRRGSLYVICANPRHKQKQG